MSVSNFPVTQPVSGTITANAGTGNFNVIQLHNAGRTYLTFSVSRIASVTVEALVTMNINKGGILTTGTSYTVTTGKILRLYSFNISISGSNQIQSTKLAVRSAAAVLASSPIIFQCEAFITVATTGAGGNDKADISEGIEIAAGQQIGISQLGSITSGLVSCCLVGFEY